MYDEHYLGVAVAHVGGAVDAVQVLHPGVIVHVLLAAPHDVQGGLGEDAGVQLALVLYRENVDVDNYRYYYLATFMGMTWRLQQLGGLSVGTEEVGSTCRLLTT